MRSIIKWFLLVAFAPLFWGVLIRAESSEQVPYPEGYRRWVHVRSALVGPENPDFANSGGLRHVYANDKAMEGYREGRFPDGSIIVFDLLETQTKGGLTTEGRRRYIAVMHKESKRFEQTGGWGFEVFRKDSHTDRAIGSEAKTKCFDCHAKQKEKDFVFGSFRQ